MYINTYTPIYQHHSQTNNILSVGFLRLFRSHSDCDLDSEFPSDSTMFPSTASSHSSSGNFGCPPVFGQGNHKGDLFGSKPWCSETVFGSQAGMSNYGGTSTWGFGQTATLSAPWSSGFGSSTALGFSPVHTLGPSSSTSVEGLSKSHGISTWTFGQTSSPLSTQTTFSAPSSYSLGSSASGGPWDIKSTFNFKQFSFDGQKRGSKVADYKRTAEGVYCVEKLVSISAMPVYKAKSHEELRWEDYNFNGKGGFSLTSSAVKSTSSSLSPFSSSSVANFSTTSWGTNSISTKPVKPNPFRKTFPSVASETATWQYPGPTSTSTSTSTSFTSQPLNFSSSSRFPCPTFESFTGGQTSTPSDLNTFWSTPIGGPTAATNSVLVSSVTSGLTSTSNQPTTLFKPCDPSTQKFNGETIGIIGLSSVGQPSSSQIISTELTPFVASPFGTLPPEPRMYLEGSRVMQSIQYGISSIPVKDKPAPVRHSLLTTRHLSRRSKLPVRKYDPKLNGQKIPYFSDIKEIPVDVFVPRENPRALVVGSQIWKTRAVTDNIREEKLSDDPTKYQEKLTTVLDTPSKLQQPDYYTKPQISEFEANEKTDPGFCSHVKDFIVGRQGYGSIKFLGETDVRNIDLETHVQFNKPEVIVYMDGTKKPPAGKGLNKPAEITLLNIKCIDRKTGMQSMDVSNIDRYTEMLKKKAVAQGAEFMSYD